MTTKNTTMTTTLGVIAVLAIASVTGLHNAFAEENSGYKTADGITTVLTFTFKDGIEVLDFPIFNMEDDFVDNNGSPNFSVEGVVKDAPHLHQALDYAFTYQTSTTRNYDYKIFDVDVDFIKDGESIRSLNYNDCRISDYKVKTLTDDYESYMSSKTGFAIIDDIDFQCAGINSLYERESLSWKSEQVNVEYPLSPYKFAENIRTFVTFEFDSGIEKIEFPYFETTAGFSESLGNVNPEFLVEGTMFDHPLLDQAIDNARNVSGIGSGSNIDFEATVELTKVNESENGEVSYEVLRTLEYKDCRVNSAEMSTLFDKEEGFTGKSGFAYVEQIGFSCAGLDPSNNSITELNGDVPIWKTTFIQNNVESPEYPKDGPKAIATFTHNEGVEVIYFPMFTQTSVLGFVDTFSNDKNNDSTSGSQLYSSPAFELEGAVGDYPMLYAAVDDNLSVISSTGLGKQLDGFNVDVELFNGDKVVRGFNYVDCRVTDYVVETQRDKEESYFKGFALSNTFDFECSGYHPNNPMYDVMFNTVERAQTVNTGDLRETHSWGQGFYIQ